MQATRTLRSFMEDDVAAAEAKAEVAVDAVLWDGDAMRDEKKRALAEGLERVAQEKRARLEKLDPHQRQLRVSEFFTRPAEPDRAAGTTAVDAATRTASTPAPARFEFSTRKS